MSEKLSKRELQSPDTFQTTTGRALGWAHDHPREMALIGVGLLAALVVIGVVLSRVGDSAVPGGKELAAALALVDRPVSETTDASSSTGESFPSETAKQEAISAALTQVRNEHEGSTVAALAALPLANARMRLGLVDEALPLFQEFIDRAPADSPLRFVAHEGKARALMAKGDLAAAAAAWDEMEKATPAYADRAIFGRGELLERQGKLDEARKAFEAVKDFKGGSVLAGPAGEHIANLERLNPSIAMPSPTPTANAPAGGQGG